MPDNINLATFQFDTAKLEQSLSTLQDTMFKLKKEQESYTQTSRNAQKEINELTKVQTLLIKSGQGTSEAYAENAKRLDELNAIQKQAYKQQQDTATQMSRVRQEVTATNTQLKAYMNTEAQQTSLMDAGNIAIAKQITNINQARASNTELLRVRNQLNPTITAEAKLIQELNNKLDSNNKFIKENASAYEQQKINIGNYTQSIKDALGNVSLFGVNLSSLQSTMAPLTNLFATAKEQLGGYVSQIKNSAAGTEGMSAAQKGLTIATNVATGATKIFTMALAATGIGLIIAAVVLLIGYFKTFDPVIDKIEQAFAAFGAVIRTVQKFIVELFSSFENLGKFLKDPIGALGDLTGKMKEAAKAAAELKAAQQDLADQQRAQSVLNKQQEGEIARLMLQARDRGKTEQERIDLLNKAEKINAENFKKNSQLAEKQTAQAIESARIAGELTEKEVANLKKKGTEYAIFLMNQGKITEEEVKLIEDAENAKIEIYNRSTSEQEKIINRRNLNIEKQEAAQAKAAEEDKKRQQEATDAAKEKADAAIKAMQTELDFYLESQGDRKKSMSEQLEIDKETMRQQLAITKAEYDAKKLNKREFELANLEITNEFAAKQVEATIANADLELELFKLNHQRKIDENQFFSDELYKQELERINKVAEADAAALTLRYANGLLSAEEYNLAIAQVDETQRQANETATNQRKQAQKEQEAADIAIQDELNAERFEYDLALQMERYKRERAQRKEAAILEGADMKAFDEAEKLRKKKIEEEVQNNKLELASNTFGQLSTILGKESAVGKAAAVAQATIDTYQAATAAYKAMAGIPVVGPALGAVAATAAVVSGIANVKKIVSVKVGGGGGGESQRPSYARGGFIDGPGTGTSDNVPIDASRGEFVVVERAMQMFPEIASMNAAAGGVGLNGTLQGSSSAMIQESIRSNADSAINTEMIAEAVMLGAKLGTKSGTAEGMIGLSDNRNIMADAKH